MTVEEQKALREAQEALVKAHEAFKKANDENIEKHKATSNMVVKLQEEMDKKTEEINVLLTKMNRTTATEQKDPDEVKAEYKKLLRKALQKGFDSRVVGGGLSPEEVKVLSIGIDPAGGYLSSTEYMQEIIKAEVQFSPVREYARIISTSKPSVTLRKRTRRPGVTKKLETASSSENTNIQWGQIQIATKNYFSKQITTNENLEDSDFNIEEQIVADASFEFGVSQGADFISGNGAGSPQGILTNTNVNQLTTLGTSPVVTADDIIQMYYGVYEAYASRGVFMFNRGTIQFIRTLKSDTGVYLWQPGLNGDASATLMGRPVREAVDLTGPVANAFTSADKIGIFGDFARGYGIVDRMGINILRDPYSLSGSFETQFVLTQRTGAAVLDENALCVLKVK